MTAQEKNHGAGARTIAWRLTAFLVGLALLGWCVSIALKPHNREQISRLKDASPGLVVLMLALTAASILNNGLLFWVAIRPTRRVPHADVQAVNAVAWVLNYLPLRLGFIFRVVVHNRRNRVPLITVGGWMMAVSVVIAICLAPAALASASWGRLDAFWWAIALGGPALMAACLVPLARFCSTGRGWTWAERAAAGLFGPRAVTFMEGPHAGNIREGIRMLAHPGAVATACALRLADLGLLAWKFHVAARLVGASLPMEQSVHGAAAYFLVGSIAPTGELGAREAVTTGMLQALHSSDYTVAILLLTAAETVVALLLGVIGASYLGPAAFRRTPPIETKPA